MIKKHLTDGVDIRRVGLIAGGAPPRQHAEILTEDGKKVSSAAQQTRHPSPVLPAFLPFRRHLCHYIILSVQSYHPGCPPSGKALSAGACVLGQVGEITSGAFSPNINKNIAMGYVQKGNNKSGTKLKVAVRGRQSDAEVTKMPFVKTTYFRPS